MLLAEGRKASVRSVRVAVRLVPRIHGVLHSNVLRERLEGEDPVASNGTIRWVGAGPSVDLVQPGVQVSRNPLPPEAIEASMMQVEYRIYTVRATSVSEDTYAKIAREAHRCCSYRS